MKDIIIIGAGLSGAEAAWQAANMGANVTLYEMRPVKSTPAHKTAEFAELVCSNSLRGAGMENAVGVLKEEMRRLNSIIMEAADVPQVHAHILIVRTPGGMASTLRDYRAAFNYARQRGQKVWFYCDGDVASGGAFAATMSDGIYAFNPDDEIGSLGMYCAFFTQKDGDKDAVTQETYHEYYATGSEKKNDWYRAAAEGDMSLIAESVDKDLQQLLANVKADRPQVLDEQLTGKMYRMGDVVGSLIDGFSSLGELAGMALSEWRDRNGAEVPAKTGAMAVEEPNEEPDDDDDDKPGGDDEDDEGENNQHSNNPKTDTNMKSYPKLGKAAGLETAFEQQADGYVSLTEEQADMLEANIESATSANEETVQALADEQAKNAELTVQNASQAAEIESLTQQLTEANAKAEEAQASLAAKEEELASAQAAAESAAAEAQAAHETAIAEMQTKLDEANTTIESRNATIEDLTNTIETLNESAGEKGQGGGAPENNGAGVETPTYSMEGQYDHSLSPAENRRRIEA